MIIDAMLMDGVKLSHDAWMLCWKRLSQIYCGVRLAIHLLIRWDLICLSNFLCITPEINAEIHHRKFHILVQLFNLILATIQVKNFPYSETFFLKSVLGNKGLDPFQTCMQRIVVWCICTVCKYGSTIAGRIICRHQDL